MLSSPPDPHSAVHLKYTGTDGSSYINANFIKVCMYVMPVHAVIVRVFMMTLYQLLFAQGLHGEENGFIAAQGTYVLCVYVCASGVCVHV